MRALILLCVLALTGFAQTSGSGVAPSGGSSSGSGVQKGNGSGGFSAATPGTDYATPQSASVILTSGSAATWTVPAGVYRIFVEMWGGGGGGRTGQATVSGSGGGGGGFADGWIYTTPGNDCNYDVGTGGPSNTGGGSSVFTCAAGSIQANAGAAGGATGGLPGATATFQPTYIGAGGTTLVTSGSASNSAGVIALRADQGGGGAGGQTTAGSAGLQGGKGNKGGGGGGSGSRVNAGGTAAGGFGGDSGSSVNIGGAGAGASAGSVVACGAGEIPGGGGGGGGTINSVGNTGCAGARGEIRIYY